MTPPIVRTDRPPEQGQLVPEGMPRFHQWKCDGIEFELFADGEAGFILADPQGTFEVAGQVEICGDRLSVNWQGAITAKPVTWLNAQRALADARWAQR
jgi:hypothetical protein